MGFDVIFLVVGIGIIVWWSVYHYRKPPKDKNFSAEIQWWEFFILLGGLFFIVAFLL